MYPPREQPVEERRVANRHFMNWLSAVAWLSFGGVDILRHQKFIAGALMLEIGLASLADNILDWVAASKKQRLIFNIVTGFVVAATFVWWLKAGQ